MSSVSVKTSSMAEEKPYVDMRGIVLVKTESYGYPPPPDCDLFEIIQNEYYRFGLPRDFCAEDELTGDYRYFVCQVCDSTMESVHTLRSHVFGKKHTAKVMEHKRKIHGVPNKVVTAAAIKDSKRDMTPADITLTLAERLEEEVKPAIGLQFVTEFVHSRDRIRYYTCSLDGCNSAWGSSDDMARHVTNTKHHKNVMMKEFPDDQRIRSMNKADILAKATDMMLARSGDSEVQKIKVVQDNFKHHELATRPPSWSAKKDGKTNGREDFINPNAMPLGQRRAVKREYAEDSGFGVEANRTNGVKKMSSGCVMAESLQVRHLVPVDWERKKRNVARKFGFSR